MLTPDVVIAGPEEIEIGRHGLDVRRDGVRGLLLPQVAVEHRLDGERFLAETCRKAGLPGDAWRDAGTEIRAFEAEVFGDTTRRLTRLARHEGKRGADTRASGSRITGERAPAARDRRGALIAQRDITEDQS